MIITKLAAVLIFAYLIGSIPFGVLIGRKFAKVDVRNFGSGKMGATNVARVAGKKVGVLVGVMDLLKGGVAVGAAWFAYRGGHWVFAGSWEEWLVRSAPILAALAAMAGHTWPVFLGFRGGRGVATFFGGLAVLCPPVALLGGQITVLSVGLTRYVSLGSIVGAAGTFAILLPLTILNGFPVEYLVYALIGTVAIVVTHRDNIVRLLAGTERRFGEKAPMENSPPNYRISG